MNTYFSYIYTRIGTTNFNITYLQIGLYRPSIKRLRLQFISSSFYAFAAGYTLPCRPASLEQVRQRLMWECVETRCSLLADSHTGDWIYRSGDLIIMT